MTEVQKTNLLRIVSYTGSACVPMFLRNHLNPRVPKDPNNMLFLRNLLLDYREKDEILLDQSLKCLENILLPGCIHSTWL